MFVVRTVIVDEKEFKEDPFSTVAVWPVVTVSELREEDANPLPKESSFLGVQRRSVFRKRRSGSDYAGVPILPDGASYITRPGTGIILTNASGALLYRLGVH